MKRNIIYTAACLVAFASCQKQEVAEAPSQVEVAVELTASAAADATKTVMTEYNAHWWSVSDKISLYYTVEGKTGHSVFTSKNLIPAASAKFAGCLSLPAEDTDLTTVFALAVYPATTADASDGTSVNVTVPSVQTAVEGSFMEGAYPVVAKTSDLTAALSFKAVCGGVKVSFQTPGITSFTFDAKEAKIAGTASVKIGEDGTPVATLGEGAASVITVNAPAGGFEVGKWYYMTAFPATLTSGYTVTLSNGKSFGGSSSIAIKRSVFGVLDSKDAPGTYADIKGHLKPISWWNEMKDFMLAPMAAPYTENAGDKNNWAQHLSKIKYVRFTSDESYVYGYIETEDNLASYSNLNFWIDADGIQEGQGGGWWFSSHKGFEKAVSGKCYNNGAVVSWIPKLYDQITSGVKIGTLIDTPSVPGYGEGVNDNGIFKYSFIVDRRVVKIRNMSSVIVGINLTAATTESNQINPNRGGFLLSLQNSEPILDGTPILKKVRSVDEWDSVEYASITNKGNNRGDTRLKFDSDSDYIYGYIEVPNTDNLYFKNGEYYEFCPGFIKRLAIGIDLDGVEIGQGIGWPIGNCWETVLNGTIISCSRPLSDEDKALGWKDRWGHYIFPSDKFDPATIARPAYTITPEVWTPTLNDASAGGLGTVKAGTEYWQYFATGKGEWKDKCFRYSFAIERNRLGLKDLTEVKLGVFMYEDGVSGYSNTPDAVGTTLKLNN
mgnify:CR=1 FL=1